MSLWYVCISDHIQFIVIVTLTRDFGCVLVIVIFIVFYHIKIRSVNWIRRSCCFTAQIRDDSKPKDSGVTRERRAKPEGCNKLFMGNVAYEIDDDTICNFFKDCGEIVGLRWLTHKDSGDLLLESHWHRVILVIIFVFIHTCRKFQGLWIHTI